MDPFTAAMLGTTALSGVASFFGGKSAASAQSKAADKAIRAQFDMQREAQAYQQNMLAQAASQLGTNRAAQEAVRREGMSGASDAINNALLQSNAAQRGQFDVARADLAPYTGLGAASVQGLADQSNYLFKPFTMDQAALEATPGYQFTLQQGLRAQQNSATARGLGLSGAALRGAADYTTGLADQTYGQQFQREMDQRNAVFNRLFSGVQAGQGAAGQLATLGSAMGSDIAGREFGAGTNIGNLLYSTGSGIAGDYGNMAQQIAQLYGQTGGAVGNQLYQTGQGVGGTLVGQGNAQAGGIMSGVNALTGGANTLTNYAQLQALLKQMNPPGGAGMGFAPGQYQNQPINSVGQYGWSL